MNKNDIYIELVSCTKDPEIIIESAARNCYKSEKKMKKDSNIQLIKSLIKSGHESVLEHASATFFIDNVSRSFSHQLVRHRLASFSQQSQRYVDEENFEYMTPNKILNNKKCLKMYDDLMEKTATIYKKMRENGISKEDARFVLPNACKTSLHITANFREWRHILKLRMDKKAQWEIQYVAAKIFDILYDISPNVFVDLLQERTDLII